MRWVTFARGADGEDRTGLVVDSAVHALPAGERRAAAADRATRDAADVFAIEDVVLRAPIPVPPTVRDFYAFEQHVKTARQRRGLDMDPDWYELPVFYFSNPYAVVADGADVAVPPGAQELDFELEVAAIIG